MRSILLALFVFVPSAGAYAQSAAAQLALVFEGQNSEATVHREIARTLKAFGEPVTDDNVMRVGQTAVAGYSETGAPELQIIDCAGDIGEQRKVETIGLRETLALCSVLVANKNARN